MPRKQSYGYLEWQMPFPRSVPMTESGRKFRNILLAGCFMLTIPLAVLTYFAIVFMIYVMKLPQEFREIGVIIILALDIVLYQTLIYLAYPIMGKIAYDSGRINEEEYRWIKRRRIPGSFVPAEQKSRYRKRANRPKRLKHK